MVTNTALDNELNTRFMLAKNGLTEEKAEVVCRQIIVDALIGQGLPSLAKNLDTYFDFKITTPP